MVKLRTGKSTNKKTYWYHTKPKKNATGGKKEREVTVSLYYQKAGVWDGKQVYFFETFPDLGRVRVTETKALMEINIKKEFTVKGILTKAGLLKNWELVQE